MKLPAIASKSFLENKSNSLFMRITKQITKRLKRMESAYERATFIHKEIDKKIDKLFQDPLISKHVSCKKGCAACCTSEVAVTEDEAMLLAKKVLNGHEINFNYLEIQAIAKNDSSKWLNISNETRRCVFLNRNNECSVYENRPAVCRTNHVVSDPEFCSTSDGNTRSIHLLKTHEADMIIVGAFLSSSENGILPYMLKKSIDKLKTVREMLAPSPFL